MFFAVAWMLFSSPLLQYEKNASASATEEEKKKIFSLTKRFLFCFVQLTKTTSKSLYGNNKDVEITIQKLLQKSKKNQNLEQRKEEEEEEESTTKGRLHNK